MVNIYGHTSDFERNTILEKMDDLDYRLTEEQSKEEDQRNSDKEFELMYAKFIAGLKLNTGGRLY